MATVNTFASVFFLVFCFSDIASLFLICSTIKSSRASNYLSSTRRNCLSRSTKDILFPLIPPFRNSTNKEDLLSKYPKLETCISRLIRISLVIEITDYLSKSSPSIFQSAVVSNCHESPTVFGRFCIVTRPMIMFFSFRNVF